MSRRKTWRGEKSFLFGRNRIKCINWSELKWKGQQWVLNFTLIIFINFFKSTKTHTRNELSFRMTWYWIHSFNWMLSHRAAQHFRASTNPSGGVVSTKMKKLGKTYEWKAYESRGPVLVLVEVCFCLLSVPGVLPKHLICPFHVTYVTCRAITGPGRGPPPESPSLLHSPKLRQGRDIPQAK